ncbi:MAG TPA: c-type cytochrome [Planctomycetaceae bacterium]|nr:c-type cytochrome [Planctomycetaceae bacterium]
MRNLITVAVIWASLHVMAAAQIQLAADAPLPLPPAEAERSFKLPPGFRMELLASEPLVHEPSGVCWDECGRLYVCELHGYNLDGHYDIEELNKTGQLDHVVRRIQATDEAKRRAEAGTTGTIKRLIDTDGDGCMDKAQVFADDLPPCYGMVAARGGLIVACSPHIMFLADRDDDGTAEVREILFTGFPEGVLERRLNAPQWGLDGWIYFGGGPGGTEITGPNLKTTVTLPRTDFRIKPDGSAIEPVSGTTWGLGFAFTETDERFVSSIGWPGTYVVPLPWQYLARNPFLPSPSLNDINPPDRRAYPISQPHPWRAKRADDPGFNKLYTDRYGIAESAPNGYFTSCCAPLVYQDSLLPGLRGQLLACEPAQNMITRMQINRDGSRLLLNRVAGEEQSEFLASTDQWFHPISLAHAPDGTIVMADFYREIIEDYSAIPRYLQQQYNLIAGREHGRLWRLTHDSVHSHVAPQTESDMSGLSPEQLASEIASPRHWRRQTAHRLLLERNDASVAPRLAQTAKESKDTAVVLHALYVLRDVRQLKPVDVIAAMKSLDAGIREHGLRLAEPLLDTDEDVKQPAFALVDDAEPSVRLQLALSLGESRDPAAISTLAQLAITASEEPWLDTAIGSSVADRADQLIAALFKSRQSQQNLSGFSLSILDTLASLIGTRRDEPHMAQLLVTISALDDDATEIQKRLLEGMIKGLKEGTTEPFSSIVGQQALARLLSSPSPAISGRALQIAGLLRLHESPAMDAAWNIAIDTALDQSLPLENRLNALSLLSAAPLAKSSQLKPLLDARQPIEVQLAAVRAVSMATEPQVIDVLMTGFAMLSPEVRAVIVDAACSRQDRLPRILDLLEQHTLSPNDLPPIRRLQLLEHSNVALRTRAAQLLIPATSAERKDQFERYQAALVGPRDATAGKLVFEKTCSKCHQLGKDGFTVGPDLDSVRTRPDESLLLDILDPSSTINPKFVTFTVATINGRIASGLLISESATSMTLRREKNETETILRKDIEEFLASSKSLMPEGIEKEISPQQLADLIAYLRESLGPSIAAGKMLFDDEPSFIEALNGGDGTATLISTDKSSGEVALRMTPLQRSSPLIRDWNFRIVETPKPTQRGEPEQFRYLRFAWKTVGGHGVMFELADSGNWPPADKPLRRYYSGKNSSNWSATQVSPDPPEDWTTVTVDLWNDFGEFTLTGIAPTAMGGPALFDRIELLRTLDH